MSFARNLVAEIDFLVLWAKDKYDFLSVWLFDSLPIRGMASEVVVITAETRFMKTVSDRRIVTSARGKMKQFCYLTGSRWLNWFLDYLIAWWKSVKSWNRQTSQVLNQAYLPESEYFIYHVYIQFFCPYRKGEIKPFG